MTTAVRRVLSPVFGFVLASAGCSAVAAPIYFDCDVPADRFSAVSQPFSNDLRIKGSMAFVVNRSGRFAPSATISLKSVDGRIEVVAQFVAEDPNSEAIKAKIRTINGESRRDVYVADLKPRAAIDFDMSVDKAGRYSLILNGQSFVIDHVPIMKGKASLTCSTAQVQFSDVTFEPIGHDFQPSNHSSQRD